MSGGTTTTYAYNADGARVKRTEGGATTYYIGNWFEVTQAGAVTKYYYFGGTRVAMKQGSAVTYLHGDHLGSTSVASNASGALVSRQTYFPYGAPRTSEGALPTDYTFTGQRADTSAGLMYYNARYYDAALGRFISADTIIPNPYNPQDLNRYSYVRNNPVRYTDPSGHCGPVCLGFIGAGAGLAVDVGWQMRVENKSFEQVDWGRAAGATVGGFVFAATMGKVPPATVQALVSRGAIAGLLGGQASRITNAVWDDAVKILNGQGLDGQRLLQTMAEKGILDPKSLTIDAGTGVLSAGTGKIFDKILASAGLSREAGISVSSSLNEIKFDPVSGRFVIMARSEVWMTPTQMETFINLISRGFWTQASDLLQEIIGQQIKSGSTPTSPETPSPWYDYTEY